MKIGGLAGDRELGDGRRAGAADDQIGARGTRAAMSLMNARQSAGDAGVA